ncbi:MAG: penicillin acylase family protein [Lysobacterales bacterium]
MTWGASDIVDLFAEQLIENQPNTYWYRGQSKPFETREEIILVRDQNPVVFDALRSIHGPIVRVDEDANIAYAKKRSWDGIELNTLLAWLRATWASNWREWKTEAEQSAINVNMYFADDEGNIGYFHGGHFPLRAEGHDNRFPVTGDGSKDWMGRAPMEAANPHVLNPVDNFLANWNNKPGQGVMNPDFFFYSWSRADRVDYLHGALADQVKVSPDEAWGILSPSSYVDVNAPYLLPLLDRAASDTQNSDIQQANTMLQAWNRQSTDHDGDGYYDQQATGLFRRFVDALIRQTLSDDLGKAFPYFSTSGYPTAATPTGAGTNIPAGLKAIVSAMDGSRSKHYQDQLDMYQQFGRKRMWFYRPDMEAHQTSVTTLNYSRLIP